MGQKEQKVGICLILFVQFLKIYWSIFLLSSNGCTSYIPQIWLLVTKIIPYYL